MPNFNLKSKFQPQGDQPQAIDLLTKGFNAGIAEQTLLGVTGSGKTFTMANVIKNLGKPTLIISHNKTLSAQLFSEFREFFPENSVEYFVSYYDYYQPEAYVPRRDLYIEKEADINETIERYRSAATQAILSRKDVIIVASVSCIYGIGNPDDYMSLTRELKVGEVYERDKLLIQLHDLQYERADYEFSHGMYRLRGDVLDINDTTEDFTVRIEFFGEEIESIKIVHTLTGEVIKNVDSYTVFPAKQFVTTQDKVKAAVENMKIDLEKEVNAFEKSGKRLEAERLNQRTKYDIEMLQEVGYCNGIENYSRYIDGRPAGTPGSSLLDYFPKDWLVIIDESHITLPQIRGMYAGDRSRKDSLVEYGFRLSAARDNRPLKFEEFNKKLSNVMYVSATPNEYEIERSKLAASKVKEKHPEIFES